MTELEKTTEARLRKELRALGCLFFKFVSPGNAGVPDRLVVMPDGRVVFVELKREDGILSPQQTRQIARLRAQGCDVRVLWGPLDALEFVQWAKARVRSENED